MALFTKGDGTGVAVKKLENVFGCSDTDYGGLGDALYAVREVAVDRLRSMGNLVVLPCTP